MLRFKVPRPEIVAWNAGRATRARGRLRRRYGQVILLLLLPMALAPTPAIAVYGYLAARNIPGLMPDVHADADGELDAFLRAPAQVERYRSELMADMAAKRSVVQLIPQ